MNATPGNKKQSGNSWLIAAIVFLFVWALFWSVDTLFVYLSLGGFAFCVAKYLLIRLERREAARPVRPDYHTEQPQSQQRSQSQPQPSLSDQFQNVFIQNGKLSRKALVVMAIFSSVSFFFFIVILAVIFGDDSSDFSLEEFRARDYYDAGNYDLALHHYRLAMKDDPENTYLMVDAGNCHLNLNRYDSALWFYNRALEFNPENNSATHNIGLVYYRQRKYREAIRQARKVLADNSMNVDALLLAGDAYYTQTQYDSALVFYVDTYNLGYRTATLTHIMAYIYDVKGKTQQAIPLYRETLELDDSIIDVYARLGELLPGEEGLRYRNRAVELQQGSQ
ncbi:MAG: tetratricopeptide repeat protein [Cyclobacteriaceae bacterium]|nr:tetratricopeptide repeat protein [Cyclobacteriaceae bacterium]